MDLQHPESQPGWQLLVRLHYEIDHSWKVCLHRITHLIISCFLFFLVGTSAIAAGVSTALTSAAAITTIFGVGGAGEHES